MLVSALLPPPHLDAFLVVDSPNHLETNLIHFGEVRLCQANVLEDLDHSLAHTDTSVLHNNTYQVT